jgi:hypothetical protein
MIDHEQIQLNNINKLLDFEIICRELDSIDNADILRDVSKGYIKLYLKNQEVLSDLGFNDMNVDK